MPITNQVNKLNLGCGPYNTPKGWINLDGSWNARLSKYPVLRFILRALGVLLAQAHDTPWPSDVFVHDLRKPLPFQDDSMDVVYSSHTLEHLHLEEAKRLLTQCFRVLRPGGVLRICVPDLRVAVQEYTEGKPFNEIHQAEMVLSNADMLNIKLGFCAPGPPSYNAFYRMYTALTNFHTHKWMYDAESLILWFVWAGFVEVEERKFHQSRIEDIGTIEEPRLCG
jgi:predicted SAM-dependent methyltransferase